MRPTEPGPALVGGFVLGGMGLAVAAVLFFGGSDLFSRADRAVAFFEGSVGGLSVGAPVTFRGVQVGSVTRVALVLNGRDMRALIPVDLKLEPDRVRLSDGPAGPAPLPPLRRMIDAGLRAKLVSQSFVTGQMLVELDFDPKAPAHLVGGDTQGVPEIPAIPSDLEELRQQITHAPIAQTVVQAERTLVAIEKVANQVDAGLGPLLANITRGLDSATQAMDTGRDSIVRVQQDASAFLAEGTALAHGGREQLAARGPELSRALRAAEQALRSANGLFVSADSLIAPRSRERDDLDAALRDLASSISSLRGFSQAVDRDPSVLLRGRAAP